MEIFFKSIGLFLLFLLSVWIGFLKAAELKRRAFALRMVCESLQELQNRLRYEGTERVRIINDTFGANGITEIKNSETVINECGLNTADKNQLEDYFKKFGASDTASEEKRAAMYLSLFLKTKEAAEKTAAEQGKLYRTVGVCAGAAVCLLLI